MEYRPIRGVDQAPGHNFVPVLKNTRSARYRRPMSEYILAVVVVGALMAIALFINSYFTLRQSNADLQRTVHYLEQQRNDCHARLD